MGPQISRRQMLQAAGVAGVGGAIAAVSPTAASATPAQTAPARLVAYVGSYGSVPGTGGIDVFDVKADGSVLTALSRVDQPNQAGYLVYSPTLRALYSVDERKTDGRGPVGAPAAIHAFSVDQLNGGLTHLNSQPAPGPFPTFLSINEAERALVSAEHGSFDHVEQVTRKPGGGVTIQYAYDSAAALLFGLNQDGSLTALKDIQVLSGHGNDPNTSPQVGGHSQASAHAHSAVFDPSGRYVLVCDKGTDRTFVFSFENNLLKALVSTFKWPAVTGPRHLRFDSASGRAFVTCELSSQLACLNFDPATGTLKLLDIVSSVAADFEGYNEVADVRVHPAGKFVYVNNRGEDTVAWYRVGANGKLSRAGAVGLARSLNPGVAARSFAFDPTGRFVLVADRPANLVRSYAVDASTGNLSPLTTASVADPAFIEFGQLRPS